MATLPSFNALKARASQVAPRHPAPIQLAEINSAIALIRSLPIDASNRELLANLLRKTAKRLSDRERQARRIRWNYDTLMTRVRMNALLSKPLEAQLAILLNRHKNGQGNAHHIAVGKRTALILGREHYKTIGRLGADSRWKIHRLCKAISVAAASHIDWTWK